MNKIEPIRRESERAVQIVDLHKIGSVPSLITLEQIGGALVKQAREATYLFQETQKLSRHLAMSEPEQPQEPVREIRTCNHRLSGMSSGIMCGDISTPVTFDGRPSVACDEAKGPFGSHLASWISHSSLDSP
jgi:hypothetical protein